ncbi:MAG: HAD hydrolase family protein [Hominenteromicrobium sp.]
MGSTLYISDLDGTLLCPEVCLSPFTAETIRRLVREGMLFSYATARSFNTAGKVTGALGRIHLPVIVYNGEAIADAADGTILNAVYFTPEETSFLRTVFMRAGLRPVVYSRAGGDAASERVAYLPDHPSRGLQNYLDSRKGDRRLCAVTPETLYDGRAFYFTMIEDDAARCEAPYREVLASERFNVLLQKDVYSDTYWFEVMPKAASKANAVRRLASLYGCGRIVCFGDGDNDRSMFRIADESYAVANAAESLKAEATAVIGSNREDGVAKKLLELWQAEKTDR